MWAAVTYTSITFLTCLKLLHNNGYDPEITMADIYLNEMYNRDNINMHCYVKRKLNKIIQPLVLAT